MKKYSALIFILLWLFSISAEVWAQLPNKYFGDVLLNDTSHTTDFQIEMPTQFFLRNTEYFNPIADGRTLFGFQVNPRLAYALTDKLILKAGIFAQRNFGEGINKVHNQLTFSVIWRANASNTLIFGNLADALAHPFIEPLYHFERQFERPQEEGVQWLHNSRYFQTDTYLDWERYTFPRAGVKEQFTFGSVSKLLLLKKGRLELNVPFQFTAFHTGGTIDTLVNAGASMWWHFAPGIELITPIGAKNSLAFSGYYIRSSITAGLQQEPYRNGGAFYLNVFYRNTFLPVMISYFEGQNFAGALGTPLMFSRSSKARDTEIFLQPTRRLLFLRFLKEFQLSKDGDYRASFRFEPYYDIVNRKAEMAMGFYMHLPVKKAFRL